MPEDVRKNAWNRAKTDPGWHNGVKVGATGALNHVSGVVGTPEGTTTQIGLALEGLAMWRSARQEWRTTLKIVHAQTRTPVLDQFFKSADQADLVSTWLHRLMGTQWLAVYGRARASTPLLSGYLVKAEPFTTKRKDLDGNVVTTAHDAGSHVPLTGPLEPLLLGQSAGVLALPLEVTAVTLRVQVGVGAQELLAKGHAVADDAKTPEIELDPFKEAIEIGAEAEASAEGQVTSAVTWKARAAVFLPAYTSVDTKSEGLEVVTTELSASVAVKLSKWLSLDYALSAKRVPLVSDEWQLQNAVLLTAGFQVGTP